MDPPTTCCPHLACPARGQTGQGTMGLHACKDTRCMGTECLKPCSATQGTAWVAPHLTVVSTPPRNQALERM